MSTAHSSIYELLHGSLWIRSQAGMETGHTLLYRNHLGVSRVCGRGRREEFGEWHVRNARILGLNAPSILLLEPDWGLRVQVEEYLERAPLPQTAIFEGYAFNSSLEGGVSDLSLAAFLAGEGIRPMITSPSAADAWNNKPLFRRRAEEILGEAALVKGVSSASEAEVILSAVHAIQKGGKVIVKLSGAGGFGNLILSPEESGDHPRLVREFLERAIDRDSRWALVEEWKPWKHSFCCSFFILPDEPPVHMEICEQVLSPATAGFIGGKSFSKVSKRDRLAVAEFLRPLVDAMQKDGIVGFVGIDVILSEPQGGDLVTLPDSGLSVSVIEVNARLNGHNQERLFAYQVGRREGVSLEKVVHMRVGNRHLGTSTREEAEEVFAKWLEGRAEPLSERPLVEGWIYFVLDDNGSSPSLYDAILLFGIGEEEEIGAAILEAVTALRPHEVLKD